MPGVGIAAFIHESNSFNRQKTNLSSFERKQGRQLVEEWSGSHHEIGGMLAGLPRLGLEAVPLASAWAMPSGPVEKEAFETILDLIIERVKSASLDGLLLALHGAMVAEHVPDADGEIIERLRQSVGPDLPIVLTLDLHANVSARMIKGVDATTIYRTYPHLDQRDRGLEAAEMMAGILSGRLQPVQALENPPLLINILAQSTDSESMQELYGVRAEVESQEQVISASIALGFPYADVEEMGSAFVTVANASTVGAREGARRMARKAWDFRENWNITGMPIEEAIQEAAGASRTPVTLLDVGDNIGGGSPGDSLAIFSALLEARLSGALVVLYDPKSVARCVQSGVGNPVRLRLLESDSEQNPELEIEGRVRLIHDGLFQETEPRHGGKFWNNQGLTAVVETGEDHTVVLTSLRMAPFSLEQILSLGIKPERKKVLIAKGAIAPRAAYQPVSARMIEVDSPGITTPNPERLVYHRRRRPLFPLERNTEYPESSQEGADAARRL